MSGVKVICEVRAYLEREEKATNLTLEVESHWNYRDRVYVRIGSEETIVVGRQLIAAIENCMNTLK